MIELLALAVLTIFPANSLVGLKQLMMMFKRQKLLPINSSEKKSVEKTYNHSPDLNRREIIKNLVTLPVFGGFVFAGMKKMGWESYERKHLKDSLDAVTGATVKSFNYSQLKDLKGILPYSHIGDLKLSRVILGGNLVGGWAHA